jgi:uncharacterized protein YjbI with pentapeptide repeats
MKRSIMLTLTALSLGAAFPAMAACTDPASAEVDWEGCNVSGANLRDANLRRADLSGSDLSGAMSLYRAKLTDTNLSGATWTDGKICAAGSIGTCD